MLTLHEALIKVREMPKNERYGICGHLEYVVYADDCEANVRELVGPVYDLFTDWYEYSGDLNFPIALNRTNRPTSQYMEAVEASTMWIGNYGAARYRLLDYLIERTKPRKVGELVRIYFGLPGANFDATIESIHRWGYNVIDDEGHPQKVDPYLNLLEQP